MKLPWISRRAHDNDIQREREYAHAWWQSELFWREHWRSAHHELGILNRVLQRKVKLIRRLRAANAELRAENTGLFNKMSDLQLRAAKHG